MTIFPQLRSLVRIARALEEANRIARERLDADHPKGKQSKPMQISRPTVEQWNESHRRGNG